MRHKRASIGSYFGRSGHSFESNQLVAIAFLISIFFMNTEGTVLSMAKLRTAVHFETRQLTSKLFKCTIKNSGTGLKP